MVHKVPRAVVGLLAGLSVLQIASGRCGGGQWGPGPRQRLLSDELREACSDDARRLVYCSTYSSPYTLLTANQRAGCCASLQQFNRNGCFCGWGAAADVDPWLQAALVDLAAVVEECAHDRVPCRAEEEYFREAAERAATAWETDPRERLKLLQGLHSGLEGPQERVLPGPFFRGPDFAQRRAPGDEPRLFMPRAVQAPVAKPAALADEDIEDDFAGSDSASMTMPILAKRASQYKGRERDEQEHVLMDMSLEEMLGDLGDSGNVVQQAISSILLPLMDVKVLKKLLALLTDGIKSDDDSAFGDAEGQIEKSRQLDIEVEIEHSGPDLKELSSGLKKMASWVLAVSKGEPPQDMDVDPMDRVDNLPLLVTRLMDLLNEFLQFPNAQVELALDITVETEQLPSIRRGKLEVDQLEASDAPEHELDMRDLQGEGLMAQREPYSTVLMDSITEEELHPSSSATITLNAQLPQAQLLAAAEQAQPECWMAALVRNLAAHPGLLLGVGAALIGFAAAALILVQVEERRVRVAQMQKVYPVVLASDDSYLSSDLTTPLLDTRGCLLSGYPTGKQ
eukprot:jgi/Botrbrau1/6709/Bobra.0202s0044.1